MAQSEVLFYVVAFFFFFFVAVVSFFVSFFVALFLRAPPGPRRGLALREGEESLRVRRARREQPRRVGAAGGPLGLRRKKKTWSSRKFSSSSPSPAPRFLFGVGTYESLDGDTKAVVFGGEGKHGYYFNDAWEFGCREQRWEALTRGAVAASAATAG